MCNICNGIRLNFNNFRNQVLQIRQNINNIQQFVNNSTNVDRLRFSTGDEWGEPSIYSHVKQYIFSNNSPDEGLLLFTLCCWLDMQLQYTTVWTTYLQQAHAWVNGMGNIPRGNYPHTTPHLNHTMRTLNNSFNGSISNWFIQTVNQIVNTHGQAAGNLCRFAGEVCTSLYNLNNVNLINTLRSGNLPPNFSGGGHKRFWMFIMFLRRDNSVIRCLLTRALNLYPNGRQAINYWYAPNYFDPIECELPVDSRVLNNWNQLFRRLGLPQFCGKSRVQVAQQARTIARQHNISPSVFDAILFF